MVRLVVPALWLIGSVFLLCCSAWSANDGKSLGHEQAERQPANWSRWRGPGMDGIASGNPPVRWSESQNVRFKVKVPGLGSGTPIAHGDTLYLLTAIPHQPGVETGQKLKLCRWAD